MIQRALFAAIVAFWVTTGFASAQVTFVLDNGERLSGTIVYHGDANVGLSVNGQDRQFPQTDVAAIIYDGGSPTAEELGQLPVAINPAAMERHTLVLRNGRIIRGKVYHWHPDRMIFETLAGRAEYSNNDIARLYLGNAADVRSAFNISGTQAVASSGQGQATGAAQATARVEANRPWTDTGLVVRAGERIEFHADGTITIGAGPGMTAGPDGNRALPQSARFPVRVMPSGALIGRVGNGRAFPIGSTRTPIEMPNAGRLFLGINDDNYVDNSDGFDVQIFRR